MVAPLLPLAMMSMMPGMMPGMGLAMGAGAMAGGGLMGGLGKGIGNALGGGGLFGGQKPKDIKFDKVTIKSLEIKDVSITNLSIGSTDKAEEGDKEEEDKGKIVDKTLTSDLEQEGSLTEKGFVGGMEDSLASPIEGMSDSNSELNEVLTGKSSIGGGFPELTSDTGSMDSGISEIADNTKILEEMFNWKDKDEEGGAKGTLESIFDYILEGYDKLWGSITDIAKGAYTVVADFVNGLWDKMVESAQLAIEAFVAVSSEAREWVGQITESIQMVSGEMREWIVELAGVGIEIGEAIGEQVRKTFDTFVDQLNKTAANLVDMGVKIGTAVSTEMRKWTETITNSFTSVFDSIGDNLAKSAGALGNLAKSFGEAVGLASEGVGKGVGHAAEGIGKMIHGEQVTDISGLLGSITSLRQDVNKINQNVEKVVEILANPSNNVWLGWESQRTIENRKLGFDSQGRSLEALNEATAEHQAQIDEEKGDKGNGDNAIVVPLAKKDINLGQRADNSRGMATSYTKAAPKVRGHSARTVAQIGGYNQFPKWRTRMG